MPDPTDREIVQAADGFASQAEDCLRQIPFDNQTADVRHALIKLAAARRGLEDAIRKAK